MIPCVKEALRLAVRILVNAVLRDEASLCR